MLLQSVQSERTSNLVLGKFVYYLIVKFLCLCFVLFYSLEVFFFSLSLSLFPQKTRSSSLGPLCKQIFGKIQHFNCKYLLFRQINEFCIATGYKHCTKSVEIHLGVFLSFDRAQRRNSHKEFGSNGPLEKDLPRFFLNF